MRYAWTRSAAFALALLALAPRDADAQFLKRLKQAASDFVDEVESATASARSAQNAPVAGSYLLERFYGLELPASAPMPAGAAQPCPGGGTLVSAVVTSGMLTLHPDGRAEVRGSSRLTCLSAAGETRTEDLPQDLDGPYRFTPGRVVVGGGRDAMTLVHDPAAATLALEAAGGLWRRSDPRPSVAGAAAGDGQLHPRYGLLQVNGQDLPYTQGSGASCATTIVGGALELTGGEVRLVVEESEECDSTAGSSTVAHSGSYGRDGSTLLLRTAPQSDRVTFTGEIEADRVLVTMGALTLTYQEGAVADPMERIAGWADEQPAGYHDDIYHCEADPLFSEPRTLAVTDSAGLGILIERAAPGYRLATEKEIACRAAGTKGFEESGGTHVEPWGSGTAWWVWKADLDSDDGIDRAVAVSRIDDPAEGGIVLLLASGGGDLTQEPMVYGLTETGTITGCEGESVTLSAPGLIVDAYFGGFLYVKNGALERFDPGC